MRELAKRRCFNENYVSRILDLAVLSSCMTEAIFRDDHDPSLTAAQLIANLEINWIRRRLPGYTLTDEELMRMTAGGLRDTE
jgi:hypothetical protein